MRNLVDKLERLAIFENDFLLVSVLVPFLIFFFIVLSFVDLVVWILHVFTKFQQELCFVFEELEKFEVVLFCIEGDCGGSSLSSFVYLFDEGIYGFASLDGHIFIFLNEEGVEFIEEVGVVLGGDQVSFQNFEDQYFFFGWMLTFGDGGQEVAYDFFLEA